MGCVATTSGALILAMCHGTLKAACLQPVNFDSSGPPCADYTVECRCTECMTWDDEPDMVGFYEIWRRNPDGTQQVVGLLFDGVDDDGNHLQPPRWWCFAKDVHIPREGQSYFYSVKACIGDACSAPSPEIEYVAAPYATRRFRPPIQGN